MTSIRIIRIPILPFHMVNAYIVSTQNGCILVDTGLPGSEIKIGKHLTTHGLSFRDIKLIVVTHAHVDHAGSAARLRELSGAPIVGHEGDIRHYRRESPMTYCPSGWAGRLFLKTPIPHEPYSQFEPDILLHNGDELDLASYGIPGMIRHTPGHTAGSISVQMSSHDALVGDLIASGILIGGLARRGRAIHPPFEDDPRGIGLELQRLLEAGAERFYMGHGGPLGAGEVQRHAHKLVAMAPRPSHQRA